MAVKPFARKLAAIQARVAKLRDQLRVEEAELAKLMADVEEVHGSVVDAMESLGYAIDRLSEQQ